MFKKYRPAGAKPPGSGKNEAVVRGLETICTPMYATYCVYEGDPEVEICSEEEYVGDNCETVWVEDPVQDPWPPTEPGDPCSDPASGCNPGDGGGGYPQPEPVDIIIDPSVANHAKTNCIVLKLGSNNRAYNNFLIAFKNNTNYNVTFKRADVIPAIPGHTPNASTVVTPNSPNIDIFVRTSYVNDYSSWDVARALVHEMAHAYIAQRLITIGGAGNLKQHLEDTEFKALFDYYTNHVNPVTGTWSATENNDAEHAAMAGLFIDEIAYGIKDFVEANTPGIKNNPLITFDHYKAAAWVGLRETEAYANFKRATGETDLTQDQKHNSITPNTSNDCNN